MDPRRSPATHVHVLNDQVRSAVVDKSAAHIRVVEQWVQLRHQLLLAIVLENHSLILLDDREALVEDLLTVLLAHEAAELGELARRDVDHLFLAGAARHIAILALVVDSVALGVLRLRCRSGRVDATVLR